MLPFQFHFLFLFALVLRFCHGTIFSFEMHHRYSDEVKVWYHSTARSNSSSHRWPDKGTMGYYAELAERDRLLRGRKISEIEDEPVTFSDGNSTFRISALGFLHYTTVTLGTPGMKFLVALDTGSDLFWVPCDCTRCAPIEGTNYGADFELSIYNPKGSSTSKKVNCNNNLCLHRNKCTGTNNCPYVISYVSADTSTSGILIEDVLHLTTEDHQKELVQAYVTFGCGQIQTGSFLDIAAPNGLFGLGMENISVPSILSREGFIADSFSMCFGRDGVGRISFGDKGSPNQRETMLNVNPSHPTYNVTVTEIRVGTSIIDMTFTALFDSGTSFTYLVEPAYSHLTGSFHSQARDSRRPADSRIPFEYCYDMRPDANTSIIPSMSLTMDGGSFFPVYDPIIVISTHVNSLPSSEMVYCLAVVKSTELNIIGQNFMTGYRIVFDREKQILGWESSDCYDIQVFNTTTTEEGTRGKNSSHVFPATAIEPDKTASSKPSSSARRENSSSQQSSIASPVAKNCYLYISSIVVVISTILLVLFSSLKPC